MSEIHDELSRIQQALKAPKGQTNSFGGYKYRSCEDILEAVKPILGKSTILITDAIEYIGTRHYVKATAHFMFNDVVLGSSAYAREPELKKGMDESQITGAASSYARKYALNGLLLIDDTKDADHTNKHETPPDKPKETKSPPATDFKEYSPAQWKFIKSIGEKDCGMSEADIISMVKWKAEQLNVPAKHWTVARAVLGDSKAGDNPKQVFSEILLEWEASQTSMANDDETRRVEEELV